MSFKGHYKNVKFEVHSPIILFKGSSETNFKYEQA